jgi:hypothetical protein
VKFGFKSMAGNARLSSFVRSLVVFVLWIGVVVGCWGYHANVQAAWAKPGVVKYYHNPLILGAVFFGISAVICLCAVAVTFRGAIAQPSYSAGKLRFTIRDVMLLTVAVALALACFINYRTAAIENRRLVEEVGGLEYELYGKEYTILNPNLSDAECLNRLRKWAMKRRLERDAKTSVRPPVRP